MTDISELVQSLKVAVQEATPGQWFRSSVLFNGITDSANPMEQGNKPHVAYSSEKGDANFIALANPVNILALTAALEQAQARISELEAQTESLTRKLSQIKDERDALRESELGPGASNTRTAADIYFQLAQELDVPPNGSLVETIDNMRERIAELEARTVNTPGTKCIGWLREEIKKHDEKWKASLSAVGIKWESE